MIRLNGIKAELEFKATNERLGRVCHILFNTECRMFMALNMVDGVVLDKKGAKNGWVDISELCMWYNRKVNYANVRFYALKLIENDPVIVKCVKSFQDNYIEDFTYIATELEERVSTPSSELHNEVADDFLTIGKLTGALSKECYQYLKDGSYYDIDNEYVVNFRVIDLNTNSYKDSVIEILSTVYVGDELHAEQSTCINNLYGSIVESCQASGYAYYAVRRESYIYEPGDYSFNSKCLMQDPVYDDDGELIYPLCTEGPYKGFYLGEELSGTCSILFYDEETLQEAIKELNYSGDKITIIAGDSFEYGNDLNEVIMHNARVIYQYGTEDLGL